MKRIHFLHEYNWLGNDMGWTRHPLLVYHFFVGYFCTRKPLFLFIQGENTFLLGSIAWLFFPQTNDPVQNRRGNHTGCKRSMLRCKHVDPHESWHCRLGDVVSIHGVKGTVCRLVFLMHSALKCDSSVCYVQGPILLLLMLHLLIDITAPDTPKWQECVNFCLWKHRSHFFYLLILYLSDYCRRCLYRKKRVIRCTLNEIAFTVCGQVFVVSTVSRHELCCLSYLRWPWDICPANGPAWCVWCRAIIWD